MKKRGPRVTWSGKLMRIQMSQEPKLGTVLTLASGEKDGLVDDKSAERVHAEATLDVVFFFHKVLLTAGETRVLVDRGERGIEAKSEEGWVTGRK